jgi:3-hydroxymyristoyl/3-hydroxydecanoyl-(acyl carrier protein) dehydratase
MRFVRQLPTNEQGKTTLQSVRSLLNNWSEEPVVLSWKATADELTARLVFPLDMKCFQGHFPSFPVLPGVAQLFFLRYFSTQVFSDFPETVTYKRLKFQKVILPSKEVTLVVARKGEGTFGFSISGESGMCSSGIVERSVL